MKQATAGLGDASRRTMLVADMPTNATPARACPRRRRRCSTLPRPRPRSPMPSMPALVAYFHGVMDVPPPRSSGLSYFGRRLPLLDAERYPAPPVPPPLEPSILRTLGPPRPIRRHSSPAEHPPSRAPDGGWLFDGPAEDDRPTTGTPPPRDADDTPRRGSGHHDACLRGRTNGGPTPVQDEEDNNALASCTVKCGKFMMIGVASLVLVFLVALGTPSLEWLSC